MHFKSKCETLRSVGQLPLQKPISERPVHAVEQVFGNQPKLGIAFDLQFAVEKQSIRVFLAHHHAHKVDAVGGKAQIGRAEKIRIDGFF